MALQDAQIDLSGPGRGVITVGGVDLTKFVRALNLDSRANGENTLILEIPLRYVKATGPMNVEVDAETADTLIGLGWTPPREGS